MLPVAHRIFGRLLASRSTVPCRMANSPTAYRYSTGGYGRCADGMPPNAQGQ